MSTFIDLPATLVADRPDDPALPRLRQDQVRVPICPRASDPFDDEALCVAPRNAGLKYYLPRYRLRESRDVQSGEALSLDVRWEGAELTVVLTTAPPEALAGASRDAVEMDYEFGVSLVHPTYAAFTEVEDFKQQPRIVADGIELKLQPKNQDVIRHAMSEIPATKLVIRKRVKVALPVSRQLEIDQLTQQLEARKRALGAARDELNALQVAGPAARKEALQAEAQVNQAADTVTALSQRLTTLESECTTLPASITSAQASLAQLLLQRQPLIARAARAAAIRNRLGRRNPSFEPEFEPEADALGENQQKVAEERRVITSLTARLAGVTAERGKIQTELGSAQEELDKFRDTYKSCQRCLEELEARRPAPEAAVNQLTPEIASLAPQLDEARTTPLYREVRQTKTDEIIFFFPKDSHGYIYNSYPADSWLDMEGPPERPRTLYYRRGERPWTVHLLPSEFHLGFNRETSLPGLKPVLYAAPGADAQPDDKDLRIKLTVAALPWLDPRSRRYLRQRLAKALGRPWVDVYPAADMQAEYQEEVGPARVASMAAPQQRTQIDLSGGFTLEYHLKLEDYVSVTKAQLASRGAGISGNVFVPLSVRGQPRRPDVDVRLSFKELLLDVIETQTEPGASPRTLTVRNRSRLDVTVEQAEGVCLTRTAQGEPTAAAPALLEPPPPWKLPAEGELSVAVRPTDAACTAWSTVEVEVDRVSADGFSAERWLTDIHRAAYEARVLQSIRVHVVNLVQRPSEPTSVVGVKVVLGHGSLAAQDELITASQPTWSTQVMRTLASFLDGEAGDRSYTLTWYNVYSDGTQGLAQQLRTDEQNPVLTALPAEGPKARYELRSADGQRVLLADLDAAAARTAISALDGSGWRLALVLTGG